MEQFDAEKARRVWSRVQGRQQPNQEWSEILAIKSQTADIYRRISRYFRGKTGAMLESFFRQEQAHSLILSDFCRLNTGAVPRIYAPQSPREPVKKLLAQCYRHKLRLLSLYEGFANTQYWGSLQGIVFDDRAQCRYLLQLLERPNSRPNRN